MIDGKSIRKKLIGNEENRAVSPVIGVILMVAITVILAAVIAAFVLDLGQSQSANANAGVQFDGNQTYVEVQVTDMGNSDYVRVTAAQNHTEDKCADGCDLGNVGDTATIGGNGDDVDVTVVAVSGDDENVINNYPS